MRMKLSRFIYSHSVESLLARPRIRHCAVHSTENIMSPIVARATPRTGVRLRSDADCLDMLGYERRTRAGRDPAEGLSVAELETAPPALRTRVLHRAALDAGCPPSDLNARHVRELDRLVTDWGGQSHIDLPGGLRGRRRDGWIRIGG